MSERIRLIREMAHPRKRPFVPSEIFPKVWGVDAPTWKALIINGAIRAFSQQRKTARARGLTFSLTLTQWWELWESSGKWELRGRGRGRYCMSRFGDQGGYDMGNVHIQLAQQNSREAIAQWVGKTKKHPGVFCLYPGARNPYLAKAGKVNIGYFATEDEAAKARAAYLSANS